MSTAVALREIGKFLLTNKIAKIIAIVISIISILGLISIFIYANIYSKGEEKIFLVDSVLPYFLVPLLLIAASFTVYKLDSIPLNFDKELNVLRAERIEITQKIEEKKELDIFHTIQLSLNQLNEYYSINKNQARSSFRFSLFSIVLGLCTILAGVWLTYLNVATIELGYITGISGVILEFIGGAYFFMYKKSLQQVNFFFGQLIKIQDTMLSINLAQSIEDTGKKTEIMDKIITSLLERSLK